MSVLSSVQVSSELFSHVWLDNQQDRMSTEPRKRKWDQEDENAALKFSRTDDALANGSGSPGSAVDAAMAAAARVAAQVSWLFLLCSMGVLVIITRRAASRY